MRGMSPARCCSAAAPCLGWEEAYLCCYDKCSLGLSHNWLCGPHGTPAAVRPVAALQPHPACTTLGPHHPSHAIHPPNSTITNLLPLLHPLRAAAKIYAAREAIGGADFFLVARTDARATSAKYGLEDAITRANLYHEAGADASFVEAPRTSEELAEIGAKTKVCVWGGGAGGAGAGARAATAAAAGTEPLLG